ncbi:uncharacterized protein LOC113286516 [Papaver somniferum]|uniref:uncharacterized protein LOC113286516 n=1 Tax=Papaver somniferum TaxID=3469 RepID=UPI000E705FF0|nr:uncharacterized protein LOC113286516 [Papaver somniferum]
MWKCRGLARPSFKKSHEANIIKKHRPSIVALLETKTIAEHATEIVKRLVFFKSIIVEPVGFSGGVCILWNEIDIQATSQSRWSVHAVVTANFQEYASTNKSCRKRVWDEMNGVAEIPNSEWLVMGDLSTIGSQQEKSPTVSQLDELRNVINDCGLVDLGAHGPKWTWNNKRMGMANIKERLDRALANPQWCSRFPKAQAGRNYLETKIKGRSIFDSAFISNEIIHPFKHQKGKKGWMALKLDSDKAYDRVSWRFIVKILQCAGFEAKFVN